LKLPTLIIGGGISGITAAVELAEAGQEAVLIEKEPYLGGNVSGFNNYFPKLCPPACGLEINYRRIRSNPRISYYTGAEVMAITGKDGDFRVNITIGARLINNRCTACGKCAEVCPEEHAVYIPGGLAFPMKYTIDAQVCKKESCAICMEACAYDAIQLDAEPAEIEMRVSKIIVATGWHSYDAAKIENYQYVEEPDVVTNLEFEHLLAECTREHKNLTRPSDGKMPGRIAFVQCAGSRDHNHLPYCSAVCCPASVKHALTLEKDYPQVRSEIFYIDMRLSGRNEKLLNRLEKSENITLTKGKVGRIGRLENQPGLIVEVEDIMKGNRRTAPFDMVVLATGLVPNRLKVNLPVNVYGFYEPIQQQGIIPAATSKRPMDVATSVRDATSSALKTLQS